MGFVPEDVSCVVKSAKIVIQIIMMNWATFPILFNVLFCHIGTLIATIHKNVVPRTIFWRPAFCYLLIPVGTTKKLWIYVNNNTAVLKKSVMDELSHSKFCYLFVQTFSALIKS